LSKTRYVLRLPVIAAACLALSACAAPEDPARREVRERVGREGSLSPDELARFRTEVGKAIDGRTILRGGPPSEALTAEQRVEVLGVLTDPVGVFDEGLEARDGGHYRVLNAPGRSSSQEIEAYRRLWIDVETLLPAHYEFAHAYPGLGEYAFDLIVQD
jgi:hypothetical protein